MRTEHFVLRPMLESTLRFLVRLLGSFLLWLRARESSEALCYETKRFGDVQECLRGSGWLVSVGGGEEAICLGGTGVVPGAEEFFQTMVKRICAFRKDFRFYRKMRLRWISP